jgi:DNA polymerase V
MSNTGDKIVFFQPDQERRKSSYLAQEGISAGFPSPADDFKELRISIDREVVKNEEATFYARVSGESMQGAGLDDGDLLVIDRSLEPQDNKIAVCFIDGEFTVKRLKVEEDCVYTVFLIATFHLIQQLYGEFGSSTTQRMPHGNGSPIDIDSVGIQTTFLNDG